MTIESDDIIDTRRSAWGLDLPTNPEPWKQRALCAQTDPDAFFPEKGGSTQAAKRICLGCDVREECLQSALEHDERFGIWGGYSERERRRLKTGDKFAPAVTNYRRPNGHGRACTCVECR